MQKCVIDATKGFTLWRRSASTFFFPAKRIAESQNNNVVFPAQCGCIHTSAHWSVNYYKVLGVSKNSTQKEIKNAYFRLAKKHHPDANPGTTGAPEKFQEIAEAYRVLGDQNLRNNYDAQGSFRSHGSPDRGYQSGFNTDNAHWQTHRTYVNTNISQKEAEELFKKILSEFEKGLSSSRFDVSRQPSTKTGGLGNFIFMMAATALSKKILEELAKQQKGAEQKPQQSFWKKWLKK